LDDAADRFAEAGFGYAGATMAPARAVLTDAPTCRNSENRPTPAPSCFASEIILIRDHECRTAESGNPRTPSGSGTIQPRSPPVAAWSSIAAADDL